MREIGPDELKARLLGGEKIQVVDIREADEYAAKARAIFERHGIVAELRRLDRLVDQGPNQTHGLESAAQTGN